MPTRADAPRDPVARAGLGALTAGLLLAAACAGPVGVTRVGPEAVHRTLTANALSAREPSGFSVQVLQRFGLRARFEGDPAGALAVLHRTLGPRGEENRLFALAELSFLHAERTGSRPHDLATAVDAYAFLFPGEDGTPPGPLDPRGRLAADLYNRGLTESLASSDGPDVALAPGALPLPFGVLDVTLDPAELVWAGRRLEGFVAAAKLQVRGLRNRYRHAGLGAPLAASLGPPAGGDAVPAHSRIPPRLKVPATAVLRLEGARPALPGGRLRGRLELFTTDADRTVRVDGREVRIEFESSAALAYTLDRSVVWESEVAGGREAAKPPRPEKLGDQEDPERDEPDPGSGREGRRHGEAPHDPAGGMEDWTPDGRSRGSAQDPPRQRAEREEGPDDERIVEGDPARGRQCDVGGRRHADGAALPDLVLWHELVEQRIPPGAV